MMITTTSHLQDDKALHAISKLRLTFMFIICLLIAESIALYYKDFLLNFFVNSDVVPTSGIPVEVQEASNKAVRDIISWPMSMAFFFTISITLISGLMVYFKITSIKEFGLPVEKFYDLNIDFKGEQRSFKKVSENHLIIDLKRKKKRKIVFTTEDGNFHKLKLSRNTSSLISRTNSEISIVIA